MIFPGADRINGKAICSGRTTVAQYLCKKHGFTQITLAKVDASNTLPHCTSNVFGSVDDLLSFVTKRWTQHWVMAEITDEHLLDSMSRRPFFLLVSIDAPVGLRWQRFNARLAKTCPIARSYLTVF